MLLQAHPHDQYMNQCIYRYNLYKYNICICYISLLLMIWAIAYISCHTICIVINVHLQIKWKSYPHMPINGTTPTDFIVSWHWNILSSISDDNSNGYWLSPCINLKDLMASFDCYVALQWCVFVGRQLRPWKQRIAWSKPPPQKQIALPLAGLVLHN